jgi:Holliday junction resolvase RusA-like endonuclease
VSRPIFAVRVHGLPAPQGSKRHVGHGRMVESSKHVAPWRDAVRGEAARVVDEIRDGSPWVPYDGPLVARMVFTFARPKGHYRTGRNAHLLRDGAPAYPQGPPDLSKLLRSTEDALTDAGVWRDDARVVAYARAAKVWAGEDPEALDRTGALIAVTVAPHPQHVPARVTISRDLLDATPVDPWSALVGGLRG